MRPPSLGIMSEAAAAAEGGASGTNGAAPAKAAAEVPAQGASLADTPEVDAAGWVPGEGQEAAVSGTGISDEEAPVAPPLPQIRRLRICLFGGESFQRGVGKGDVAGALLRGLTADWPGSFDPVYEFAFDYGVFERVWTELSEDVASGTQHIDRWGSGPFQAWSVQSHIHFDRRGRRESTPPYEVDPVDYSASLCIGSAATQNLRHPRSRTFCDTLTAAGLDLHDLESLHQQLYAAAEGNPQRLVCMQSPRPGVLASCSRYTPRVGSFEGCGVAVLHVFQDGFRPLNSRNVAMIYATAPNGRVHDGLTPGKFLTAVQGAASNIARMVREYNWLAGGEAPMAREREQWWETDVRGAVEFYLSDRNLRTDQRAQELIATGEDGWIEVGHLMTFPMIASAGVSSQKEIVDAVKESKSVETRILADGRAFLRRTGGRPTPRMDNGMVFRQRSRWSSDGELKRKSQMDGGGWGDSKQSKSDGTARNDVCWDFAKGFCSRGTTCNYVHVIPGSWADSGVPGSVPSMKGVGKDGLAFGLGALGVGVRPPAPAPAWHTPDGSPPATPVVAPLAPGMRVQIQGLLSKPQYNDRMATLRDFDEILLRWQVQLDDGSTIGVKDTHLRPC